MITTLKSSLLIVLSVVLFSNCQNKKSGNSAENTMANDSTANEIVVETDDSAAEENESTDMEESEIEYRSPAVLYKDDNTLYVYADMHQDFRMFGYERPDTTSRKMILFSIFTSDVEGNPFKCPLGSYYDSRDISSGGIEVLSKNDSMFIKAQINIEDVADTISRVVFFERDLIYIE